MKQEWDILTGFYHKPVLQYLEAEVTTVPNIHVLIGAKAGGLSKV